MEVNYLEINLFRMTHISNIAHIAKFGLTRVNSELANTNYKAIGDSSLIAARSKVQLPNKKMLNDAIPFYFGVRMPMLYVIQNGFNGVNKISQNEIVYCVTNIRSVIEVEEDIIFSDGHGRNRVTRFYGFKDLPKITKLVNFNSIQKKYWNEDAQIKREKEAEFLLFFDLPEKNKSLYLPQ